MKKDIDLIGLQVILKHQLMTAPIRKSCLYAQSVVENYKDKILEAWKDQDIKYLADLDYISLIDWKHYQEIISRRVA
jgi:hypothetical protein